MTFPRILLPLSRWAGALAILVQVGVYAQPTPETQTVRNETFALLTTLENGGQVDRVRLAQLVRQVRENPNQLTRDRYVVTSRAGGIVIKETAGLNRAARFAAYEAHARSLASEFPDEEESYESLLALANDHPDQAKGAELARQLQAMATAPTYVKAGAQRLLDRHALVGKPLNYSFPDSRGLTLDAAKFRGKVVVLYAWSGEGKKAPRWISSLLHQGNSKVVFIGVNFDKDSSRAQAKIRQVALGSRQAYDPVGLTGTLAEQLKLSRIPSLYLIDQSGIVRSVNARQNLSKKLQKLLSEGGRS